MKEELDLWEECKSCDQRCCRHGNPMILPEEREKIVKLTGREEVFEDHNDYFVLKGKPCPFLQSDGRCGIQEIKPLDCKAYPLFIKPIGKTDQEWCVDIECPIADNLSSDFINAAKKLFLSLPRKYQEYDWLVVNRVAEFKTKRIE